MGDFTEKKRLFSRTTGDPFAGHFFNETEIDQLITDIFGENMQITKNELFTSLNNIISFLGKFYPDTNTLTPGKTDEIKLFKKIEHHTSGLQKNLNVLLNQYGYDTWLHIKPYAPEAKEIGTKLFLNDLSQACQMLGAVLPIAKKSIKDKPKKKTGNNSMQAISRLIRDLIPIYEKATGKSVDKNFHQDRSTGSLRYKGQFFDFVHYVISAIKLYPDTKKDNPYKICLEDASLAVGKHIHRIISNIKKTTCKEAG